MQSTRATPWLKRERCWWWWRRNWEEQEKEQKEEFNHA